MRLEPVPRSVLGEAVSRVSTTPPAAGYSSRSLPEKLGFKPGMAVAFLALPVELDALAGSVEFGAVVRRTGWGGRLGRERFDAIHAFTTKRHDLESRLPALQAAIKRDGMIWVSWPKKSAGIETEITEDFVRSCALALDLVDVKVAAVDAVWSGLKLMIRKERR